jgi:hypothetical protein
MPKPKKKQPRQKSKTPSKAAQKARTAISTAPPALSPPRNNPAPKVEKKTPQNAANC